MIWRDPNCIYVGTRVHKVRIGKWKVGVWASFYLYRRIFNLLPGLALDFGHGAFPNTKRIDIRLLNLELIIHFPIYTVK